MRFAGVCGVCWGRAASAGDMRHCWESALLGLAGVATTIGVCQHDNNSEALEAPKETTTTYPKVLRVRVPTSSAITPRKTPRKNTTVSLLQWRTQTIEYLASNLAGSNSTTHFDSTE